MLLNCCVGEDSWESPLDSKELKPINPKGHEKVLESEITQTYLTLCDPMDCSSPGSSIHGIFQAIVLEWVAISFSGGSSRSRDQTQVSRIVDRHFTFWITKEVYQGHQPWIFIGRSGAEAEATILWAPDEKSQLIGKDPDAGKDYRQEEKKATEDEMVGWHHRLNGHEFEKTLGVGDGQGGLACCSSWGHKNWTWLSKWTELNWTYMHQAKCQAEDSEGQGSLCEWPETEINFGIFGGGGFKDWGY